MEAQNLLRRMPRDVAVMFPACAGFAILMGVFGDMDPVLAFGNLWLFMVFAVTTGFIRTKQVLLSVAMCCVFIAIGVFGGFLVHLINIRIPYW